MRPGAKRRPAGVRIRRAEDEARVGFASFAVHTLSGSTDTVATPGPSVANVGDPGVRALFGWCITGHHELCPAASTASQTGRLHTCSCACHTADQARTEAPART